jgi:hypothetical protein
VAPYQFVRVQFWHTATQEGTISVSLARFDIVAHEPRLVRGHPRRGRRTVEEQKLNTEPVSLPDLSLKKVLANDWIGFVYHPQVDPKKRMG